MIALADPAVHPGPVRRSGLRVLVVDNDPDAVELVVTDLTLEGHQIVGVAFAGEDAIAQCRQLQPDVLIVDVRMGPGLNGVDVVRALQDQRGLRRIVYTNYRDARLRAAVEHVGAVFLVKGELSALRAAVLGS